MRPATLLPLSLATLLLLSPIAQAKTPGGPEPPQSETLDNAATWLLNQQDANGCIQGSHAPTAWTTQTLAAAGYNPNHGNPSLVDGLKHCPPPNSQTANNRPNAIARHILAITAAGHDPTTFDDTNWLEELRSYHVGDRFIDPQNPNLLNDDMFALLALRAADIPPDDALIEDTATYLLENQHDNGGWSYTEGGTPSTDMTSAAIMALTHANQLPPNSTPRTNAQTYLQTAAQATDDACFAFRPQSTQPDLESTTWATLALLTLHQDPRNPPWSTQQSPWDCIRTHQRDNGAFHTDGSTRANQVATQHATYALTATPFGRLTTYPEPRPTTNITTNTTPTRNQTTTLQATTTATTHWLLPDGQTQTGPRIQWTPNHAGPATLHVLLLAGDGLSAPATFTVSVAPGSGPQQPNNTPATEDPLPNASDPEPARNSPSDSKETASPLLAPFLAGLMAGILARRPRS